MTIKIAESTPLQSRYELLRQLGEGGVGTFREAAPARLQARVALLRGESAEAVELIQARMRANTESGAIDEAARDRFAFGLLQGGSDGIAAGLVNERTQLLHCGQSPSLTVQHQLRTIADGVIPIAGIPER